MKSAKKSHFTPRVFSRNYGRMATAVKWNSKKMRIVEAPRQRDRQAIQFKDHQDHDGDKRHCGGQAVKAGATGHADARHKPGGCRTGQAVDAEPILDDGPRP